MGDRGDEYNFCPPENDSAFSPEIYHAEFIHNDLEDTLFLDCKFDLPLQLAETRDRREELTEDCPLTVIIRLPKSSPVVDFQVRFDNRALDHRLEVRFPSQIPADVARYDSHFDVVERPVNLPDHDLKWWEQPRPEVPQQAFADVSDASRGLMLANQGLPEVAALRDSEGNTVLALTLLRCVGWLSRDDLWVRQGHAGPALETPDAQEQGIYEFAYRLIPHVGDWRSAASLAYGFQTSLRGEVSNLHAGSLAHQAALVEVDNPAFHLTAIKTAEDKSGLVVRGYNQSDTSFKAQIGPGFCATAAALVKLDESFQETVDLSAEETMSLDLQPHKLVSVLFSKPKK